MNNPDSEERGVASATPERQAAKKTALISVSDKTGLPEFAQALAGMDVRILSTGGTLKFLREKGVPAVAISEYTGSPEILDGRVKTLHPKIHGGLLGIRDSADHREQMRKHGIESIDIVAVNLYPFRETVAKPDVALEEAIENIDIGGPAMLRSSAKNHRFVTVVCDPADYGKVVQELKREGDTSPATRQALALKVFRHTADYDSAIDEYLSATLAKSPSLRLSFVEGRTLRYGENDHQKATFFLEKEARSGREPNIGSARQLHGKELSFNNLVDADAALESARELRESPAVSIIKHMNPCGYATGATLAEAFEAAWEGDPVSAFGSVIAVTRTVDLATAEKLKGRFVELLIAPGFAPEALEYLQKKSKDIRLLDIGTLVPAADRKVYKHILGGMLVQDRDVELNRKWESPTASKLPENLNALALFTWKACKHVKSNAIVIGQEYAPGRFTLVGMGPGQPNRIDSNLKLCQPRARENLGRQAERNGLMGAEAEAYVNAALSKCVMASDAFFPFDDNVVAAHQGGIRHILQPGGSLRDPEVIATADRLGVAMVFTGTRHFRH
ncbi:MAG TPA: bifunctional phosphoribosylaminoimidazolecarboxamide formyltransferase/IMP cyclohydrolase [Fibrobacteria bacterium]|nr:bifunctional phosphoribosylaminoimidazolecarboxamide formyltransferase/IMP cyclohydrolase [Fibrobacteria bacterium]